MAAGLRRSTSVLVDLALEELFLGALELLFFFVGLLDREVLDLVGFTEKYQVV